MRIRSLFSRSSRPAASREVSALLERHDRTMGLRPRRPVTQCTLMNRRLVDNGVITTGEVRHYDRWDLPVGSRFAAETPLYSNDSIYRRQKAFAPKIRGRRGLALVLDALRLR